MTSKEEIFKLNLEVDKLDSQDFPDLPLPTKVMILNKIHLMYVEACYGINNIFRQGLEETQLRIDQLEILIEKELPDLDYVVNTSEPNCYTADYSSIADQYLHLVRYFSYADKGLCLNRFMKNESCRHNELNEVFLDPNRQPSFEWQELPTVQAKNKFYVYTDGTFTPKKLHVEFLKYPIKVDVAGYTRIEDGLPSTDINSELPDNILEDILTYAARFIKLILGDLEGAKGLSVITQEEQ